MVRAKFKVTEITRQMSTREDIDASKAAARTVYVPAEIQSVTMRPVYSNDPASENKAFWNATPSGEIKLGVINQAAWSTFELDREYYVDFTPA